MVLGVFVRILDQYVVGGRGLKRRCKMVIPGPADQVTLPMAWDCTIFNRCWSFADRYGVLDLADPVPFQAGVPGAPDRAFPSQLLNHLLFQHGPRLNDHAPLARLRWHLLFSLH